VDREHHLRLVGAPAESADRSHLAEDAPPEHASAEAKLRWARALRARVSPPDDRPRVPLPGAHGLKTLALSAAAAPPADSQPQQPRPAEASHRLPFGGALVAVALLSLAAVLAWPARLQVPASGDNPPYAAGEPAAPEWALPILPVQPAAAASLPPRHVVALGPLPVHEPGDTFLPPSAPDLPSVTGLIAVAFSAEAAAGPLTPPARPVPPVISPVPVLAPASDDPGTLFRPPVQYSRADLGQGFGDLFGLITGRTVDDPGRTVPVAAVTVQPLITVHHGLGASSETLRRVLRTLEGLGYDRVFQIGVPYRIGRTNVRYYHAADQDLARTVTDQIEALIGGPRFSEPRDFTTFSAPPQPGTIDIWLSDKA
jgi:hypothetical protein